jgi:hypothetical protein
MTSPPLAEQYNAERGILCVSKIPALVHLGFQRGMPIQDLYEDVREQCHSLNFKITDDELLNIIHSTYANPIPPEPGPLDDPLPDTPKHQQEKVVDAVPQAIESDTSNKGIIESLNKKHAVIMLAGKCLILNHVIDPTTNRPDVDFSTIQDIKNRYQNRKVLVEDGDRKRKMTIAEYWLNHPNRKEYSRIVFDPSGNEKDGVYNLWQGFALKPVKGQWRRMERHLLEIICSNDREVFNYLMAWLARLVQDPGGKRPGVVPVLRGKQGTGKGIFVNNFGKIFGQHFKHIISHTLLSGRFNSHFKDALFVFIDEAFWGGNKEAEGALKGMITEDFIMVEPKGKEAFRIKNHCNFIFASNNAWVVPADTEERRMFVLDVSDVHMDDAAYFGDIVDEMENGGREAMLYDLLHHDITGIDLRAFPRREALLDQIIQTWPSEKQFWFEALRAGCFDHGSFDTSWPTAIECNALYELYLKFSTAMGDRFKSTDRVFGKKFRELCPTVQRKQKGDGKWYYFLPSLSDCRSALETLLKMEKAIDWDEEV